MSNPEDDPKFVRGQRKGKDGRIFNVPIKVPVNSPNFKGATARAEVFVPDHATYQSVTYNSPLYFYGLRNVNGHWIPGQAYIQNKPFIFYPPPDIKQNIRPWDLTDSRRHGLDRIKWTKGVPTPKDMILQDRVPFPHKTTSEEKVKQRPMPRYETPVFKPVNEKLLEKKIIDGKWGAYIDINFPERTMGAPKNKGEEWILESDPIKKFFVPYTPEYKYYKIKTVNHKAKLRNGKYIPFPQQEYRFWPPPFPGQHVKKDWQERVSLASSDNFDRFDFNPREDPLPMYIDTNIPKEEWKMTAKGKVHGYTYRNLTYPPLIGEAPNKIGATGRRVLNHDKLIGTFPDAVTRQFVEDSKYYKPVKLPTPLQMKVTETYEKRPGEKEYFYQEFKQETPEGFEFWFFPPPKEGQLMDKLTKVQRQIARSKNGQRVFIYDTEIKRFSDVPAPARGQISDADARRKKSRKGSIGGQVGQPSPLMKYAVLNQATRRAQMPPPEPSPPPPQPSTSQPVDTPMTDSPPSRKRSGEQSPPSPSKRARSQSPPPQSRGIPSSQVQGSGFQFNFHPPRPKPPPKSEPPPATQQNPLYFYNEEEAGSGSESEGEDSPTKNPSDPKPSSSKSPDKK